MQSRTHHVNHNVHRSDIILQNNTNVLKWRMFFILKAALVEFSERMNFSISLTILSHNWMVSENSHISKVEAPVVRHTVIYLSANSVCLHVACIAWEPFILSVPHLACATMAPNSTQTPWSSVLNLVHFGHVMCSTHHICFKHDMLLDKTRQDFNFAKLILLSLVLLCSVRSVAEGLPASEGETGELCRAALPGTIQPGPCDVEIQQLGSHRGLSLSPHRWKWSPDLQRRTRGSRSLRVLVRGMGRRCREELQSPPGWIRPHSGSPDQSPTPGGPPHHHPRQPRDT